MQAFLPGHALVSSVARVTALTVMTTGLADRVFGADISGWIHVPFLIAAMALAVLTLALPFCRGASCETALMTVEAGPSLPLPSDRARAGRDGDDGRVGGDAMGGGAALQGRAHRIAAELEGHRFFTRLLRQQIEDISAMTGEAAASILGNLGEADRAMAGLLGFIDQSGEPDTVALMIDRVERQMAENRLMVDQFQAQRAHDLRESQREQEEIRLAVDALGAMAEGVREIARQTNMLAFNATIEAGRAGVAGRGFAVVALEVKTLSRQSDRAAQDIRAGIDKLQETVRGSLEAIIHDRVQGEDQALSRINAAIGALTETLNQLIGHQRAVLNRVREESVHITRPIMALMASIQFQDVIRQQLESLARSSELVDAHIERLRCGLADLTADIDTGRFQDTLRQAFDHYVMSQQRNAFNRVAGVGTHEDTGKRIELF